MENKPKKKGVGMIAVILVLIAVLGFGAFYIYGTLNPDKMAVLKTLFDKPEIEYTQSLGEFTFNLQEKKTYAKVNLSVAYVNEKDMEEITNKLPAMQDVVVLSLFNISQAELLDLENLKKNKDVLTAKINEKFEEDIIKTIYVTDLKVGK